MTPSAGGMCLIRVCFRVCLPQFGGDAVDAESTPPSAVVRALAFDCSSVVVVSEERGLLGLKHSRKVVCSTSALARQPYPENLNLFGTGAFEPSGVVSGNLIPSTSLKVALSMADGNV